MYRLSLLSSELLLLDYPGNPYFDTLPSLVKILSKVLTSRHSYGTLLGAINRCGVYARGYLEPSGLVLVVVVRLP